MAAGVQNAFSATAASNGTADSTIVASEGQGPGTLNDAIRAFMAGVKKWCKDWQGGLVTGGASTAYTLTTNEVLTLADGASVTCRMSATNGAAPTLNVDSTGAVAIQSAQGTAIAAGALLIGGIYRFTYYASSAAWIVNGLVDSTAAVSAASETVAGKVELATTAEATTGTDTARAVTPAGVKAVIDALKDGVSSSYDTLAELAAYVAATAAAIPAAATQAQQEAASSTAVSVTPGRQQFHPSAVKAHGRADSGGAIQTGSYGIASIVRNTTGNYTVTLSTATSDGAGTAIVNAQGNGYTAWGFFATASTITVVTLLNGVAANVAFAVVVMGDQ